MSMKQRLQQIYAEWQLPVFMGTILGGFMWFCYHFGVVKPAEDEQERINNLPEVLFTFSFMHNLHDLYVVDGNRNDVESFERGLHNLVENEEGYNDLRLSAEKGDDHLALVATLVARPTKICEDRYWAIELIRSIKRGSLSKLAELKSYKDGKLVTSINISKATTSDYMDSIGLMCKKDDTPLVDTMTITDYFPIPKQEDAPVK